MPDLRRMPRNARLRVAQGAVERVQQLLPHRRLLYSRILATAARTSRPHPLACLLLPPTFLDLTRHLTPLALCFFFLKEGEPLYDCPYVPGKTDFPPLSRTLSLVPLTRRISFACCLAFSRMRLGLRRELQRVHDVRGVRPDRRLRLAYRAA